VRLYLNRIVHRSPDSYIPPDRYEAIHEAVMRACDLDDGVKDGVIGNPLRCRFDPKVLECKGNSAGCLTPAQVETVKALFSPIVHPKTGTVLSPPLLQPGTELVWNVLAGPQPYNTAVELYKYVVFNNPNWDPKTFEAATDIDRALAADENVANLADPNLQPFFSRGGKLLLYHGWTDQQVPPQNTIRYFNSVVKTVGADAVASSIQLYLVPGMGHCRGGAGTDTFEKVAAMEEWMATGRAPESIMGSRLAGGKLVRTRPICAFGRVARWNGAGSSDDGAHFSCVIDR
jgi:feruloyl esterase